MLVSTNFCIICQDFLASHDKRLQFRRHYQANKNTISVVIVSISLRNSYTSTLYPGYKYLT